MTEDRRRVASEGAGGERTAPGREPWRFSVWNMLRYLAWLVGQVIGGSLSVARRAIAPGRFAEPSIVRYALRCSTDLEVTWMASSITITPGTLVVGTAHGTAGGTPPEPATVFVHSVFDQDRESVEAGLRDMEDRLLRMTRGSGWEDRERPARTAGPAKGDERT